MEANISREQPSLPPSKTISHSHYSDAQYLEESQTYTTLGDMCHSEQNNYHIHSLAFTNLNPTFQSNADDIQNTAICNNAEYFHQNLHEYHGKMADQGALIDNISNYQASSQAEPASSQAEPASSQAEPANQDSISPSNDRNIPTMTVIKEMNVTEKDVTEKLVSEGTDGLLTENVESCRSSANDVSFEKNSAKIRPVSSEKNESVSSQNTPLRKNMNSPIKSVGETKLSGYNNILEICETRFKSNIELIQDVVNISHGISGNEERKENLLNICNKLMSESLHLNHSVSDICKSSMKSEKLNTEISFSGPFESLLNVWKQNLVKKRETGKLSFEDEEMMKMESLNINPRWNDSIPSLDFNYSSSVAFDKNKYGTKHILRPHRSKPIQKSEDEDYFPSIKADRKIRSGVKKYSKSRLRLDSSRGVRKCRSTVNVYEDIPDSFSDIGSLDEELNYSDAEDQEESIEKTTEVSSDVEIISTKLDPTDNHICEICEQVFANLQSLVSHKQTDHNLMQNECEVCSKTFSSEEDLRKHVITHSKLAQLEKPKALLHHCEHCGISFRRKFRYDLHLRSHGTNLQFPCNICPKMFSSQAIVSQHKKVVHQYNASFKCNRCDKSFKTETPLKYHMMKHEGILPFTCTYCPNKYPTMSSRDAHQRTHSDEKPYMCSVCDKGFKTRYNLKKHCLMHDEEKNFQCDLCGQTFRQKSTLTSHRRVHTGEKPYICDVCGKAFTQSSILNMHKRVHSGYKPHKCTYCDSAFSCGASLRKHTTIHTGEKNFMCKVCGRCFARAQGLKHHERSHTGVKPYLCQECGKRFTCPKHVKRHMLMHTGEFPFTCNICGKQFRQVYNMKVHMRVHSGDKPFQCTTCGRCFAYKQSLQMHGAHCINNSGFTGYNMQPVSDIQ